MSLVKFKPNRFFRAINIRNLSSESATDHDNGLIILNPRQAGIVRHKRHKPRRSGPSLQESVTLTPLKPSPFNSIKTENSNVIEALQSQKPETRAITKSRFNQIQLDLVRGFKKIHLDDYLQQYKNIQQSKYKHKNKSEKAKLIMTDIWECYIDDVANTLDTRLFVENIIELSEQDFVLVLGNNGFLLREWTKSGAKISIWAAKCQIIVHSHPQTFGWIEAMLGQFLESVKVKEVDLLGIKKYINPADFPDELTAIQQLTSTYFSGLTYDSDSFLIYAGQSPNANIKTAIRLLIMMSSLEYAKKWRPVEYFYDVGSANSPCQFKPFDENDGMVWMDRLHSWSRFELLKTRNSGSQDHKYDLQRLSPPEFEPPQKTDSQSLQEQLEGIAKSLLEQNPCPLGTDSMSTLTITPGYLIHEAKSGLPNAGMLKSFSTNIPKVSLVAGTLPLLHDDIAHEDPLTPPVNTNEQDFWKLILEIDEKREEPQDGVFANRYKDMDMKTNQKLIQMKFVPDPAQDNASDFPPVEAYADLPAPPLMPSNASKLLQTPPRVFVVPSEASAIVSLPSKPADVKLTVAHSYPLPLTPTMETYFMQKCRFDRLRPLYIPAEVEFEINGQEVRYLYHSTSYMTQADLKMGTTPVQLSQSEGGKLIGRSLEACVVQHASSSEFSTNFTQEVGKTVKSALEFVDKLE